MALTPFTATATTCDVDPGSESSDASGVLRIRGRAFADIVESADRRIAGTNRPVLDLDLDPTSGEGRLRGRFTLRAEGIDGGWEGELEGRIEGGLVAASGLARGTGALEGAVLRVDFSQVPERAGPAPCASPKAFFDMAGVILER